MPTAGLVAYYPFDGNANDASGKASNGVVSGATLVADRFGAARSRVLLRRPVGEGTFDGHGIRAYTNGNWSTG